MCFAAQLDGRDCGTVNRFGLASSNKKYERMTLSMLRSMIVGLSLVVHSAVAATTAIVNVNILPMDADRLLTGQTIIVEGHEIVAIGNVDVVPVPKGIEIVDGTDRYLMPGLAELHAHVPDAQSPNLDRYFTLFVANGITTVRGMLGQASHLALRQHLLDGKTFGPRLITSGPSLNGRSVNGAADGRRQVRQQHSAGYDFIKIHPGLDAAEFSAIAETANGLGIPFAGHVPVAVGVANALALEMATIDHLDGYFAALLPADDVGAGGYGGFFDVLLADRLVESRIAEIAVRTASAGTWNVPTQTLFEQLVSAESVTDLMMRPEMRYMPEETARQWASAKEQQLGERGFSLDVGARAIEIRRKLIRALHEAGAGILLGSDAPQIFNVPGFSLHRELDLLVVAGLAPYDALVAGTRAAGEFLGTNAGIVAVGREADLLLLDANPLVDIGNSRRIHGVMLRGNWLSAAELDRRLAAYRTADR